VNVVKYAEVMSILVVLLSQTHCIMVWLYPVVKNVLKICLFISTESTNVMDGPTDRRTDTA